MLDLKYPLRPHPEVVDTEVNAEEVALLHLQSKAYYSLNLTGARIWQYVKQGLSPREICRLLEKEFEVDAKQAQDSVSGLLEELLRQELVQATEP